MMKMMTARRKNAQIFWKTEKIENNKTSSSLKNVINPFYSSFQSKNKKNNKKNGCILFGLRLNFNFFVGIENMNYIDTISVHMRGEFLLNINYNPLHFTGSSIR